MDQQLPLLHQPDAGCRITLYSEVKNHLSRFSLHHNEVPAGVATKHLSKDDQGQSSLSKHLFTIFNQSEAGVGGGEIRAVDLPDHWKPIHQPAPLSGKQTFEHL